MRHALITGGGRGLGAAIARTLSSAGCAVTINYRSDEPAARKVCADIEKAGGRAQAILADLAEPADVKRLVEDAREAFGAVHVLVANAGIAVKRNVFENTLLDFDQTFAVNVRGAFVAAQAVLADMRDAHFGRLIFVSSLAAKTGGMISTPYASSKAALEGMMHHYAASLREHGITANAIAPALIETVMIRGMTTPGANLPLGRLGRPDEVESVARMLLECGYMTGQTIHLNAGLYMT